MKKLLNSCFYVGLLVIALPALADHRHNDTRVAVQLFTPHASILFAQPSGHFDSRYGHRHGGGCGHHWNGHSWIALQYSGSLYSRYDDHYRGSGHHRDYREGGHHRHHRDHNGHRRDDNRGDHRDGHRDGHRNHDGQRRDDHRDHHKDGNRNGQRGKDRRNDDHRANENRNRH